MIEKIIAEILENHRGKALGIVIGLVVGLFLINLGFFKTLLLAIFIYVGYAIGKRVDNNDDISEMVSRFIYRDKRFR